MSLYPRNARTANWLQGDGAAGVPLTRLLQASLYREHPVLGSTITPYALVTLTTPTVLVVSNGFTQPDVPRNLVLTGNAGANETCVVSGTDAGGAAITENFTLSGTTPQVGAKAFKTFTLFTFSAGTHTCAFVCGNVLGLGHKIPAALYIIYKAFDGVAEAGTLAYSTTVLASNTYAPAGTLDGAKYVDVAYWVKPTA